MRALFFFCPLFCILILSLPSFAQKKLIIIGDSLTEGFGVSKESSYSALLENKIKAVGKNWVVTNSGISGSTSAGASARVKWALKSNPDMIILALGANDALRGLKAEETKKNINEAIMVAKSKNIKVVLAGMMAPPNYGEKYTKEFVEMFSSLAKKHRLTQVPFLLEGVAGDSKLNLADGIHPNEKGHVVMAENIFKVIKDFL